MPGTGTIINAAAIIIGGLLGMFLGKALSRRVRKETMMKACGLSAFFIGVSGTLEGLSAVSGQDIWRSGTMMMIISLCLGGMTGELIGIEQKMEDLGIWLRKKAKSDGDSSFLDGFITASLIVSIGAMAILGPMDDALRGDYSVLIAKSIMDFIIVFALSSTYGKGTVFSVIPVVAIQGFFTICAFWLEPILVGAALNDLTIVGSVLITGVGVNLVFERTFPMANYLPAVVYAIIWGLIFK